MTSATQEVTARVLEVLGLPDPATLLEDQLRGALCVWDKEQLRLDTAIDLGEQHGTVGLWWPRACPACVADRAHRGLLEHAPECENCRTRPAPGEPGACEVTRGLYRLVREARR
ncbi:hypothetical protein [Streptomyces sp. NPDC004250]|uniref:hypothetical protein n=1 Tax=Streptomyces sp. NPDC004250 TaxID=3364692 RepID=UPI0036AAB723